MSPAGRKDITRLLDIDYTGGATGRPKGGMLSHRAWVNSVWLLAGVGIPVTLSDIAAERSDRNKIVKGGWERVAKSRPPSLFLPGDGDRVTLGNYPAALSNPNSANTSRVCSPSAGTRPMRGLRLARL